MWSMAACQKLGVSMQRMQNPCNHADEVLPELRSEDGGTIMTETELLMVWLAKQAEEWREKHDTE